MNRILLKKKNRARRWIRWQPTLSHAIAPTSPHLVGLFVVLALFSLNENAYENDELTAGELVANLLDKMVQSMKMSA
jgi:hypothetical protein